MWAASFAPLCVTGDLPSSSVGRALVCVLWVWQGLRGRGCDNSHIDTSSRMPLGRAWVALGGEGRSFFLWELIPLASRVRNRAGSLGSLVVTPGNLAWPCLGLGQGPSLPQGFYFSICRTRMNFGPGWPRSQPDQEACRPP